MAQTSDVAPEAVLNDASKIVEEFLEGQVSAGVRPPLFLTTPLCRIQNLAAKLQEELDWFLTVWIPWSKLL